MSIVATTKVCSKCGLEKAVEEFREKPRTYKGEIKVWVNHLCRLCENERNAATLREYRKKAGHKIKARHDERYRTDPEYKARKRRQYREKYQRNREWKLNWQTNYRRTNREKVRNADKNKRYKKQYGVTLEQFRAMLAEQGGACWICRKPFEKEADAQLDHCHATGKARGALCRMCNFAIGGFRDNIENLSRAIEYLKLHNPQD